MFFAVPKHSWCQDTLHVTYTNGIAIVVTATSGLWHWAVAFPNSTILLMNLSQPPFFVWVQWLYSNNPPKKKGTHPRNIRFQADTNEVRPQNKMEGFRLQPSPTILGVSPHAKIPIQIGRRSPHYHIRKNGVAPVFFCCCPSLNIQKLRNPKGVLSFPI